MDQYKPTFLDRVNAGFGNPMTQFGLNLLAGSMQGDPGRGVSTGAQAARRAQHLQFQQAQDIAAEQERRRQAGAAQAEKAQQEQLFLEAISGADPKTRPILQMMGPQKAGEFLLDQIEGQSGKVMNVGGTLVRMVNGKPEVVYAPENSGRFVNVDGAGYMITPDGPQLVIPKKPSLAEQLLNNSAAPQPQAPAQARPQGGVIQQSNPVQRPTDPNLQLTAGGAQPQQAQQPEMIQVPGLRPMTRLQAEKLRAAMILEGNKDAAAMFDAALNPESNKIGEAGSNEVDKQLINTGNALSRLQEIQRQFKPEFQVWENRASMAVKDTLDRFGFTRGSIEPETRKQMEDYRKFRLSAIDNINRYIKEITGAQMSEAEAVRLRQGAPDAGDSPINPWSGDSPIAFKSKMEQTIRTMGLAKARFTYLKRNGFNGDAEAAAAQLPLERMENIIQERTQQLQQRARAEGVPPQQAAPWIQKNLKQEFGI